MKRMIGLLFFVIGIGCFFYPNIATQIQSKEIDNYIEHYEQKDCRTGKDEMLKKAESYNHKIYKEDQKTFKDPWSYEQNTFHVEGWKREDFGYILIPAMDVRLPVYIGASEEHLQKGATVLGQTSLPVGGTNTNSVIAAHRGYQGKPYFRDIGRLKPGDEVYIRNPWKKLTYVVEEIRIINPDEIDTVKIQPGRDMLTLLTCHPYRGHGKYRYVVYCVREHTRIKEKKNVISEKSSSKEIEEEKNFRQLCGFILIVLCTLNFISTRRRKGEKRNA